MGLVMVAMLVSVRCCTTGLVGCAAVACFLQSETQEAASSDGNGFTTSLDYTSPFLNDEAGAVDYLESSSDRVGRWMTLNHWLNGRSELIQNFWKSLRFARPEQT